MLAGVATDAPPNIRRNLPTDAARPAQWGKGCRVRPVEMPIIRRNPELPKAARAKKAAVASSGMNKSPARQEPTDSAPRVQWHAPQFVSPGVGPHPVRVAFGTTKFRQGENRKVIECLNHWASDLLRHPDAP